MTFRHKDKPARIKSSMDAQQSTVVGQQQQQQRLSNVDTAARKASKLKKQKTSSECISADGMPNTCSSGASGPVKKRRKFNAQQSDSEKGVKKEKRVIVDLIESPIILEKAKKKKRDRKVDADAGGKKDLTNDLSSSAVKEKVTSTKSKPPVVTPSPIPRETTPAVVQQKKKKKQSFQDVVLRHLFVSGKPFSLKGLAKAINTTGDALNYLMLSLIDKNLVIKKEYKQKVLYWANQDAKRKETAALEVSPDEFKAANDEYAQLLKQQQSISAETSALLKELSNRALEDEIKKSETEVSEMNKRVILVLVEKEKLEAEKRRAALTKSSEELKKIELEKCPQRKKKRINAMREEWRKRKLKCMDFVDQLEDAMEKKRKDVLKLLEIEMDEDVGAKMPPKHQL